MMIRPDEDELAMVIGIALKTARHYALRNVFTPNRALSRDIAIDTLTQRVVGALRRYEITREANDKERGDRTMPLFPDLDR